MPTLCMDELVLAAYSEIGLKGTATRKRFEKLLIENIVACGARFKAGMRQNKLVLEPEREADMRLLMEKIRFVFGVEYYARARRMRLTSLEELGGEIAGMYAQKVKDKKFRITARRVGRHGFTSMDVQRVVGEHVRRAGGSVDLKHYDVEIVVDVRNAEVYVYDEVVRGPGGLPIGSAGDVVVLFSGGIDSPVAAWMAMKRGCRPAFLYVNLGGEETLANVYRVYAGLVDAWSHGKDLGFYVVDGSRLVDEIKKCVMPSYRQVVLKRAFYVLAERLCRNIGASAVVTGESIGQVSTQTIKNMGVIEGDSKMLFIRPIIAFDKEETIEVAKRIGTYNASVCVGELCNISQGGVKTAAEEWVMEKEYEKIKRVAEGMDVTIVTKEAVRQDAPNIPENDSITIDIDREKIDIDRLDRTKFYVIVCKEGVRASRECEILRALGYKCIGTKRK